MVKNDNYTVGQKKLARWIGAAFAIGGLVLTAKGTYISNIVALLTFIGAYAIGYSTCDIKNSSRGDSQ